MESVNKVVNDKPDSIEIGTPGKGGVVKVYFDSDKFEEAKIRIEAAMELRKHAMFLYECKVIEGEKNGK